MEFLKNCATNILTTGDFSVIGYWIVSVNGNFESSEAAVDESSSSNDANANLSTLLEKKVLASLDRDYNKIWIFAGGGKSELQQDEVQKMVHSKGIFLRTFHIGEMQSSELCESSGSGNSNSASSTPLSASTPTYTGRHQQPLTARTPKSAVSANSHEKFTKFMDTFEPSRIYRMFITAVLSLTAFSLSSSQIAIPLGYREYLSLPYDMSNSRTYFDQSHDFYLSTIFVQLTLRGNLILSFSSKMNSKWKCMSNMHEKAQLPVKTIRLAPRGVVASFLHVEGYRGENVSLMQDDPCMQGSPKKDPDIMKWKRRVSSWLREHGINIKRSESECRWLWVEIPRFTSYLERKCHSTRSRRFLWPGQLCFYLVGSRTDDLNGVIVAQNESDPAMLNVDSDEQLRPLQAKQMKKRSDSFQSSLQLAEGFLLNDICAEPQGPDTYASCPAESSSPIQARSAQNFDIQVPNGVYPTPPDYVTGPSTFLTDISNNAAAMGDNSTLSEVESPDFEVQSNKKVRNSSNTSINLDEGSNAFVNEETNVNELFGETDREEIEANGITDADFNFFDDPEADMDNYANKMSFGDYGLGTQLEPNLEFATNISSKEGHQGVLRTITPDDKDPRSATSEARLPISPKDNLSLPGENVLSPTRIQKEENSSRTLNQPPHKDNETTRSTFAFDASQSNILSGAKRRSLFDPMQFDWKITISDAKYNPDGRYDFSSKDNKQEDESIICTSSAARTSDLPAAENCLLKSYSIFPSKKRACDAGLPSGKLFPSNDNVSCPSDVSSRLNRESSDDEDEETTKSFALDEISSRSATRSFAREISRNQSYLQHPVASSDNIESENIDSLDAIDGIWDILQPDFDDDFNSTVSDIPITSFKDLINQYSTQHDADNNSVGSNIENITPNASAYDIVQSVQILVDQVAKGAWDLPQEIGRPALHPNKINFIVNDMIEDRLLLAVKLHALPMLKDCDIMQFANLDFLPSDSMHSQKFQGRSLIRRSSTDGQFGNATGTHVHRMPAPLLRLQRYDSLLELSSSSLAFWEALSLAPASGSKNLYVYCICPDDENSRELVDNFLTTMTVVYESSKFGIHARGSDFNRYKDGIIPLRVTGKGEASNNIPNLQEIFNSLGRELADMYLTNEKSFLGYASNIVLYVMYPFDEKTSLWQICSSFLHLQEMFYRSLSLPAYAHDAVKITLQLTPLDLVASHSKLLTLQSHHYMRFACEIYDRCQLAGSDKNQMNYDIFCAPSLQLAESLPRSIPFRLSPDPPSDLLNETACIHMAYGKTVDGRWLMAAWTDNSGKRQAHVTYNLEGNQSFVDIAKEMWQTTLEIIQRRRVTWKVIIVAVMEMVREDVDVWIALVTVPTQPVLFTLLLSIGLDFPMRLSAEDLAGDGHSTNSWEQTINSFDSNVKQAEKGNVTPTNTPNMETLATSPVDLGGNLIDINDETWAIILAHRSNVSTNLSEYKPSLASGLLVKRAEDNLYHSSPLPIREGRRGPVCVALDLLRVCNSSGNGSTNGSNSAGASSALHILGPRGCDHMLREILFMYGGLGLLAKYRGMCDTRGGLIPWHVVTVTRGIKVLESCLK